MPAWQVRQVFNRYGDDLGAFMKALGYPGFQAGSGMQDEGRLIDVFQQATTTTAQTSRWNLALAPAHPKHSTASPNI